MRLVSVLVVMLLSAAASAQQALPLYDGPIPNSLSAPDEESLRDPQDAAPFYQFISRPQIYSYLLPAATTPRAAVVILPGGGYRGVSIVKEGFDVAQQLNRYGIVAFVLKYRTPSDKHSPNKKLVGLQDAQQALRLVRSKAREWNIDPHRVGLMGFSAGGHVAAMAANSYSQPALPNAVAEQVKPDFLMLAYPVISFDPAIAHANSRDRLLGNEASHELIEQFSNELHVSAQTPPTFVFHAADDKVVPVANSLRFFEVLQAHGVPSELIVFPAGGHGFGLNNATTPDRWIERCRDWLLSRGHLRAGELDSKQ